MHEYSLTKQIVKIAGDAALTERAQKVNSISLVVGENSGVIPDSLQMYFDMIAINTPAAGAKLILRIVKSQMRCPFCGKVFERPRFSFACPDCGTLGNPLSLGEEFYVESVELEV